MATFRNRPRWRRCATGWRTCKASSTSTCPTSHAAVIGSAAMPASTTPATGWSPPTTTRISAFPARCPRSIPDLSDPYNDQAWRRIEAAKRRLLYTLFALKLPVVPRAREPDRGLAFRFLKRHRGRTRDDRPRRGRHHAQRRRGRLRLPREDAREDGRGLPHGARPLPPRDRALLLGPPDRATAGRLRRVPRAVRRRDAQTTRRR